MVQLNRRFALDAGGLREMFGDDTAQAPPSRRPRTPAGQGADFAGLQHPGRGRAAEQTTIMRDRLKAAGKAVEVGRAWGDDHHLMTSASRTQMLAAMDAFLAGNLPISP